MFRIAFYFFFFRNLLLHINQCTRGYRFLLQTTTYAKTRATLVEVGQESVTQHLSTKSLLPRKSHKITETRTHPRITQPPPPPPGSLETNRPSLSLLPIPLHLTPSQPFPNLLTLLFTLNCLPVFPVYVNGFWGFLVL